MCVFNVELLKHNKIGVTTRYSILEAGSVILAFLKNGHTTVAVSKLMCSCETLWSLTDQNQNIPNKIKSYPLPDL